MTRTQYINKVKAKLEEISPFEEPASLVALDSGANANVKPIISYIEESLDEATKDCLNNLPLSLLSSDIDHEDYHVHISKKGIGHIHEFSDYLRLVRVACKDWERDVTAFITTESPLYLIQQNKYTRGGACKPVVVYNPEKQELELFSFPDSLETEGCDCTMACVYYIDSNIKAERVQSNISDFIILRCAAIVLEILKDQNADVMMAEYNNKLNNILK